MRMRYCISKAGVVMFLAIPLAGLATDSRQGEDSVFMTPENLVRGLYASVTFDPGNTPEWNYVREFFLPEAVIAVRQTRTSMGVLDVTAFVEWFKADVEKYKMKERGFEENIQKLKLTEFGDMAHCWVVYQARFMTPEDSPGQLGLDSFGLVKKDGRWWIVSITNDIVSPQTPLPKELR